LVSCLVRKWLGEIMVKGTKGAKVKVLFQGLHMTCVIFALVYNLKFCILDTHLALHFKYKYILIIIWLYLMYIMHSWFLSYIYIYIYEQLTTTYCALLRRAKQKIWRFCEKKTNNLKGLRRKKNLPTLRCRTHRNLWRTTHRKFRMNL